MSQLSHIYNRKKHSIRARITTFVILTVVLALTISGALFCSKTSSELRSNYSEMLFHESTASISNITNSLETIDSIYKLLISNEPVYNFMINDDNSLSDYASIEKQMTSSLITNNIWEKDYIESVYIFSKKGKIYFTTKKAQNFSTLQNTNVYKQLYDDSPTLSLFVPKHSESLYFIRTIYNSDNGHSIGTMIVSISKNKWIQSLSSSLSPGWLAFVYNDNFEMISDYDSNTFDYNRDISHLKDSCTNNSNSAYQTITFDSKKYLALSTQTNKLNLTTIVLTPQSQLTEQVNAVIYSFIFATLLLTLIVGFIAFAISKITTRPISIMINQIQNISDGNYSEYLSGLDNYEEFNNLQISFNDMLDKIHSYHDNILEQNILLKTAEINTLQSQLNPHFLFNVLNTLAWKAEMTDNPEISKMAIAIGEILKSTVVHKDAYNLTIQEEIKFVNYYIYLQTMRFEDKIHVKMNIDPTLYLYKIPCFCIQTLVENAYVHGLEPKDTTGELTISVKHDEKYIFISILDNGVGFSKIPILPTEKKDQTIITSSSDSEPIAHPHVGLSNLNRRLFLMYGEASVLHIKSTPNVLTSISFKIPCEFTN